MKKITALSFLLLVAGVVPTGPAQAAANDDQARAQIAPRLQHLRSIAQQRQKVRVIARFKATGSGTASVKLDNSRRALRTLSAQHRLQTIAEYSEFPLAAYALSAAELNTLIDSGLVDQVDEDALNYPTLASSVPYVKGNVPRSFGYTGSGATVAILDTGVDGTHADFGGRVVAEACFSTNYAPQSATSLCPGAVTSKTGSGSAVPCAQSISWACEHGTHVASIAAGSNAAAPGIAPAAKIIAVQVFSRSTDTTICGGASSCVVGYDSDIINALNYIYSLRNNAAVKPIAAINLSLGGGQYTANCDTSAYKTPIDSLRNANIATVIAAGNDGYTSAIGSPGCVSTAITVGSVADPSGIVSSWSNSLIGFLDILAPGEDISAAIPGGGHVSLSGTSMATPFITGAFAVLKGINSSDTVASMETRLKTYSTAQLDSRNGGTFPRLNLELVTESIVGSNQRPSIVINSPVNNGKLAFDKKPFLLSATATDVQDGNLNGGVTWSSNKDGTISSPANLSLGTHTLTASVVDNNGFSKSTSVAVNVLNAPTAAISAPASATQQLSSQPFVFAATATDIENGNLSNAIQWTSNIDGTLGTGNTLSKALSPGTHTITANVTDGDGMPVSIPPTITVTSIADVNNNGIADSWEVLYGVSDANADPDGDGLSNLQEYNLGSNPNDAAPVVSISNPAANATFSATTLIHFAATATDKEDGNLSNAIQWRSNSAGLLGSGGDIFKTLAIGTHTITATVLDSKGAGPKTLAAVQITISGIVRNGDINGDGRVDVADALLMQQYLTGSKVLTSTEIARGDMYPLAAGDGELTIADLLLLEKSLSGN